MEKQRPIGVFDSGVGGISILKAIHQRLPNEQLVYFADSAYAPYGERDAEQVVQRCIAITEQLISEQHIKALVVACNTATSVAIEILRAQFSIPIIGVEPAVKPAAAMSQCGRVGVLATSGLVSSDRFSALLQRVEQQSHRELNFCVQACPGLVEQVEKADFTSCVTVELIEIYLRPMVEFKVDTLVLGCTHYPFLTETIAHMMGPEVTLIETGPAVARQVEHVLVTNECASELTAMSAATPCVTRFYVPDEIALDAFWQEKVVRC